MRFFVVVFFFVVFVCGWFGGWDGGCGFREWLCIGVLVVFVFFGFIVVGFGCGLGWF